MLVFDNNRISNPITGDCDRDPGYSDIATRPAHEIASSTGLPSAAKTLFEDSASIQYGFVTCGGINFLQVAILPDDRALFFGEGGTIFVGERVR